MRRSILTAALILCLTATSSWAQSSHETKRHLPRHQRHQCAALVYDRAEHISEVRARGGVDLHSHRPASYPRGSNRRFPDRFFRRRSGGECGSQRRRLVFIGGVANVPAFYMMALPEIKSVGGFEGQNRRRHALRLVDRFCPALSRAEKWLQSRQGSQHPPARRHARARRGAFQTADRRRAIVGADSHPGARCRRPAIARHGQSRSLFSAHGRYHPARLPENQPRNGV